MGEPIVTRPIQCIQCGAAHQVLDDALLVICEYCGAFVAIQAAKHWGGEALAHRHERNIRALIEPTAADARKLEAQRAMSEAQARDDRATWRLWAREFYAMLPLTDPEMVSGNPDDPQQVRRWLRQSLQAAELSTFDPAVRRAQGRYAAAAGALYRARDPVATAREALAAAEDLYRVMFEHPEYPRELASADPAHMAREMVRSSLVGAATMLGPGVVARIRQHVLGDEVIEGPTIQCRGCGSSLPATHGTRRCPHCGAVVDVEVEDPWLSTMVGLWRTSREQAEDDVAEAMLVLTLGLSSYFSRKTLPPAEAIGRLLAAGPAWLPAAALQQAADRMRFGYDSEPRVVAWLDQVSTTLRGWVPRGERPAPPPPPEVIPYDAPLADPGADPWVRQSLSLWAMTPKTTLDPDSLPTTIIGFVLNPFYMGGSVSLAQALAFIEAVEPRPDREALAEAAELMHRAEAAPGAGPLLAALAAALRGR